MTTNITTREVPIDSLVTHPLFLGLFIEEPDTISRIARDMRTNGYDPARPIDVWKDGAGRGRHIVVEGHQRLQAAREAGLTTVRIAYRHFDDDGDALLWAAEQQSNRRNASREAQCLSILRALRSAGEMQWATTAVLAERFGFSTATVDRARQVLDRGSESEIVAVLEGRHGLKTAYEGILARERREAQPLTDPVAAPAPTPTADDDDDDGYEPDDPVVGALLANARAALSVVGEAYDALDDFLGAPERQVLGATDELVTGLLDDFVRAADDLAGAMARMQGAVDRWRREQTS
jgi:ParB family chromosome partitioning protein